MAAAHSPAAALQGVGRGLALSFPPCGRSWPARPGGLLQLRGNAPGRNATSGRGAPVGSAPPCGRRRQTTPVTVASLAPPASSPLPSPSQRAAPGGNGNGVYLLMLLNVVVFALDWLHLPVVKSLYLNHLHPQAHQFISHLFCHGSFSHLSNNLFNLCIFGKLVEETEGAVGVWFVYLVTGLGAAVATFLLTPSSHSGHATVSVGASGAIFGLFSVAVLSRLASGLNLKRLLEAAVLGQFVVRQVLDEMRHQISGGLVMGGMQVSHLAHLAGALAGVLLVLLLHRLPTSGGGDAPPAAS